MKPGPLWLFLSSWTLKSWRLIVVCCHLFELPWMRLSTERAGRGRGLGLECGKCPHPSSQFGAVGGADPLSAAGRHPGAADGGARTALGSFILSDLFRQICFFERDLISTTCAVLTLLFYDTNCFFLS